MIETFIERFQEFSDLEKTFTVFSIPFSIYGTLGGIQYYVLRRSNKKADDTASQSFLYERRESA